MKAIVQNAYGSPAVLELKEIDEPVVGDDGVLVRVRAAALHAGDYFIMRGVPYLARFAAGWPRPSGGVGTFAVQIARSLGAEVTGVCSTRNVDMLRSIGADHVVDYTKEDFTRGGRRYDLILDNVANRSFSDCRRALTPRGILLPNSAHAGMGYIVKAFVRSAFVRQQGRPFVSSPNNEDLGVLKALIEAGKVRPVIDRTYRLSETPQALEYVGQGHARGKVVIAV